MENIVPEVSSTFSKMWHKILNLENSLFPQLQESLRIEEFSTKEAKLIRILDFAQIEQYIVNTSPASPPGDREQIARAFVAKSVYNIQTNTIYYKKGGGTKVASVLAFGILSVCIHQSLKLVT